MKSMKVQTYSTHEGDEIFIPNFGSKPEGERGLGRWISEKYFVNNAEWIEVTQVTLRNLL
jgi:hypothetical protein